MVAFDLGTDIIFIVYQNIILYTVDRHFPIFYILYKQYSVYQYINVFIVACEYCRKFRENLYRTRTEIAANISYFLVYLTTAVNAPTKLHFDVKRSNMGKTRINRFPVIENQCLQIFVCFQRLRTRRL